MLLLVLVLVLVVLLLLSLKGPGQLSSYLFLWVVVVVVMVSFPPRGHITIFCLSLAGSVCLLCFDNACVRWGAGLRDIHMYTSIVLLFLAASARLFCLSVR